MAKFAYNNAKNSSIGYMPFNLNCRYHFCIFFKEDINCCFQSKIGHKLLIKLQELMTIYQENFCHLQKL